LAGSYLSLNLSAYVPNISSGRGWIALVAIYLGGRKAKGILGACFVFALAESFSNFAQGVFRMPSDFILAIPYAATLAALIAGSLGLRSKRLDR
jgi:simple sugar transport system permease protein